MSNYRIFWVVSAILMIVNLALGVAYVLRPEEPQVNPDILGASESVPVFSKNYIMDNSTFSSTRVFNSQESIQNYLNQKNSPLADYRDGGELASYWIWNSSQGVTSSKWGVSPQINPGVMLAFLEKEQSLISLTNYDTELDPQNRIRTAMGYGCPDFDVCDTQYYGLANQLNWAAYQLQYNYNRAGNPSSNTPYKVNSTITTLDGHDVFLSNEATASVYNYTPHVYWGNYNLWKIITANGWGTSSNTYNMNEIDQENIYNRKLDPDTISDDEKIFASDIQDIINATYTIGETSDDIEVLQTFLRQEGYYTYAFITGYYGTITKTAHTNYLNDLQTPTAPRVDEEPQVTADCDELYTKTYTIGQVSEEIKKLQECLRDDGYFDFPTSTGYYGPITDAALKERNGTNKPASDAVEVDNCDTLKARQWRIGQVGQDVKDLQQCLQDLGYFNFPAGPTGYYGPVTQKALSAWLVGNNSGATTCEQLRDRQWTLGQVSDDVRRLQECLKDKNLFNWPYITNYFGPVTQEGLNAWRGERPRIFSCADLKTQVWKQGETSERVRQLQACMRSAGHFNWRFGNTGYFGDATTKALRAWRGYV